MSEMELTTQVALLENRLSQCEKHQEKTDAYTKDLTEKLTELLLRLERYEGRFGGIVMAASAVGAALALLANWARVVMGAHNGT